MSNDETEKQVNNGLGPDRSPQLQSSHPGSHGGLQQGQPGGPMVGLGPMGHGHHPAMGHHPQHHGYPVGLSQHPAHSMPPHIMHHHHHEMGPEGNVISNIRIMPQQPTTSVMHHQMPLTSRMTVTSMEAVDGGSSDDDDDEDGDSVETGNGGSAKGKGGSSGGKTLASKIGKKKTGGTGRRKIDIKFIENKSRRQVTFSRRKRGLMKKVQSYLQSPLFYPFSYSFPRRTNLPRLPERKHSC